MSYILYRGYISCDSELFEPIHTIEVFDESQESLNKIQQLFIEWEESKKSEYYNEKTHDYFRLFQGNELKIVPHEVQIIKSYKLVKE